MTRICVVILSIALACTICSGQPVPLSPSAPIVSAEGTVEPPAVATTTLPAGTRIMMQLTSPLNTESAVENSGVYLETAFPVIHDNQVVIPAGTSVQGVVAADKRAGHFNRGAEFRMHFTTLVFSNNYTAAIDGTLQSIPGSSSVRLDKKQGKIKRVDQVDKALIPVAGGALIGGVAGSVRDTGVGGWPRGAGFGAALGAGAVLVTRGDPIHLPEGTRVEMVLSAPLTIPTQQIAEALKVSSNRARVEAKPPQPAQQPSAKPEGKRKAGLTGIVAGELLRGVLR